MLERELGGDLPCVVCRYNLKGLSIRSVCPECATPVRAAILAVVDPFASELQPIRRPRMLAACLVLWSAGALAAAVSCWAPHVVDVLRLMGVRLFNRPEAALPAAICLVVSAAAAVGIVRPHARIPVSTSVFAAAGVAVYVPLILMVLASQSLGAVSPPRYLSGWYPSAEVTRLNVGIGSAVILIVLCMRPMARVLVARSLLLRTGRVDRQTLYATAAAAGIMVAGHVLGWASTETGPALAVWCRIGGVVMVATGSFLLTTGLAGALIDSVRIARAIMVPGPSLGQVLAGKTRESGRNAH